MQEQKSSVTSLYFNPDEKLIQLEDIFSNQKQSYDVEKFCFSLNEKIEYLEKKISGLESALIQQGMPKLAHDDLLPHYVFNLTKELRKILAARFTVGQTVRDKYKKAQEIFLNTHTLFSIISKIELTQLLITLFKDSVGANNERFETLKPVIDQFSRRISEFKDAPSSPSTPVTPPISRERTVSSISSLLPRMLSFSENSPSTDKSCPLKLDPELYAPCGADIYLARVREERQICKIQLYEAAGIPAPEDLQLFARQCRFTRELLETGNRLDSQQEIKLLSELPDLVNQLRKNKQESATNSESDQKGLIQKERIRTAEFKLLQKHSAWLELRYEQRVKTADSGVDELHSEKKSVDVQLSKLRCEILVSELMRSRIKRNNHLRLEIQSLTYLNTHSSHHKNLLENSISQKVNEKSTLDKDIDEALPGYQWSDDKERTPHESRIAYIKKIFLNSVRTIEALEAETSRLRQIVARLSIRLLSGVLLQTLNINLQRVAGVDSGVTADVAGCITYWNRAMTIVPHFQDKIQLLLKYLPQFITEDLSWLKPLAPLALLWAEEAEADNLIQSMAERENYYEKALGSLSGQLQKEKAALTAIAKQIQHACEHQISVMEIKIDPGSAYTCLYEQVREFDEKPAKLEIQMKEKLRSLERLSPPRSEAMVFLIANGVQSVTFPSEIKSMVFKDWREFCVDKLLDSEPGGMNFATMEVCTTHHIKQLATLEIELSGPVFRNLRNAFLKDIIDITAQAPFFTLEDYFMRLLKDFHGQFTQLLRDLGPTRREKPSEEKCRTNIMSFLEYLKGEETTQTYPLSRLIPRQGEGNGDIWVNKNSQKIFDKHFNPSKPAKKFVEAPVAELVSDCLKVLLWRILLKFADHQSSGFEENLPTQKILENTIAYRLRVTDFHWRLANFRNTALKNYLQKTPDPLEIPLFNCVKWLWNLVSKPDLLSPKDFDSFIQQYGLPERQSAFLDRARRSYAGRLYTVLGDIQKNWNTSQEIIAEFKKLRNKIEQLPEDNFQWALITAKLIKDEIQLQSADAIAKVKKAEETARIEISKKLEFHCAEQKKLSDALIRRTSWSEENPGDTMKNNIPGVPAGGNSPYAMGDRKGENRDSPPSFRAIGSADAQDINRKPWTLYSAGMADTSQFHQLSALCRISTRQQAAQTFLQMAREWRDIQSTAIVEIKIQGFVLKLIRAEKELEGLATAGKKIYVQWDAKEGVYHYHYYVNWNGIPEKKDLKAKTAHSEIEFAVKNPSKNNFNFSPSCISDATDVIFRAEKADLEQKIQRSGGLDLSKVPLQVDESFRISMKRLQKANGYLARIEEVNKKLALPEFPQVDADISPKLPELLFSTTAVTEKESSEQLAEAQATLKAVFDPLLNIAAPLRECFHQYRKLTVQEKLLVSLKEESKKSNQLTTERFVLENHRIKLNDVAREIARQWVAQKINVVTLKKFNINCDLIKPSDTQLMDLLANYCQEQPYAWYDSVTRVAVVLNDGLLTALIRLAGGILYGEVTGKETAFPIMDDKYQPVITKIFPQSKEEKYAPAPCPLLASLENTQWVKRLSALENLHRIISAIPEPRFSEVIIHLELLHKDLVSGAWRRKRVESPQEKAKKAEALNIDLLTNTQQLIENAIGSEGLELIDRLGVQDWDIYKSMSPHISTLWSWKFDEECSAAFQALYQHFIYLLDLDLDISGDYTQSASIMAMLSILENLRTSQNVNVKVAWFDEVDLEKMNSGTECAVKDSKNTPCLDKIPDLKKLKTDPANFNKNLREKLINVGILPKNIPLWEEVWEKLTKKAIIHNGGETRITDLSQIKQNLDELLQGKDDQKNYQNLFEQISPQLREYVKCLEKIIYCCDGVSSDERIANLRSQKGAIAELLKQCFIDFNFTASSSADYKDDQAVVKDFRKLEQWLILEQNKFKDSLVSPELVTSHLPEPLIERIEETSTVLLTPKSALESGHENHFQSEVDGVRKTKNEKNKELRKKIKSLKKEKEELKSFGGESPSSVARYKHSPEKKKSVQDPSTTLSMQVRLSDSAINEAKNHLNRLLETRELLQSLAKTASEKALLVNVLPGLSLLPDNRSALDLCKQLSEIWQQKLEHSADLKKKNEELSERVLELKTACESKEPKPEFLKPWIESKIKSAREKINDTDKTLIELNIRYNILVKEEKQKSVLSQSSTKNSDDSRRQAEQILKNLEIKCSAKETYQKILKKQEIGTPKKSPLAGKLAQDIKNVTNEINGLKKQMELQRGFLQTCTPDEPEVKSKNTQEELKELRQRIITCAQTRDDQAQEIQQLIQLRPSSSVIEDIKVQDRQSQSGGQITKELSDELQKQLVENTERLESVRDQFYGLNEWILKDVQVEIQSLLGQKEEMEYLSTDSPAYQQWEARVQLLMARLQTPLAPAGGDTAYPQWQQQIQGLVARLHPEFKAVDFQEEKLLVLEVKGTIVNEVTRRNHANLVKERELIERCADSLKMEQSKLTEFLSKTPYQRRQENLNAINSVVLHDAQIRLKNRCVFWNFKAKIVNEQLKGYICEEKLYFRVYSAFKNFQESSKKININKIDLDNQELSQSESNFYVLNVGYLNLISRYDTLKMYALENEEALQKLEKNELPRRKNNWYNLNYLEIHAEVKDDDLMEKIQGLKEYGAVVKLPVLIKHGARIKLLGCPNNGVWTITVLDSNVFASSPGLIFTPECQLWNFNQIPESILNEIQMSGAHTQPGDNETTILNKYESLQRIQSHTLDQVTVFDEFSRGNNTNHTTDEDLSIDSLLDGTFN